MRFGQLISTSFILSCVMLGTTGCISVDRRGGCGPIGACGGMGCDSCSTCDASGGLGPGPISRLLSHHSTGCGCNSCGGGGCGEMYVDEWINERPVVDNCGCGECSTCGHQPVRSLLRLLWGDRYQGGCETCSSCDGGIDLGSPMINDGYEPNAWQANRGCNCGSHHGTTVHGSPVHGSTVHDSSVEEEGINSGEVIIESQPNQSPGPTKAAPEKGSSGNTTKMTPTPAPPIPKSAMRLNPASRKVSR